MPNTDKNQMMLIYNWLIKFLHQSQKPYLIALLYKSSKKNDKPKKIGL